MLSTLDIVDPKNEPDKYGVCVKGEYYGSPSNMHVFFSYDLCKQQKSAEWTAVKRKETELSGKQYLQKHEVRLYSPYFKLLINDDRTFTYNVDHEKIDKRMSYCGFYCLLTNVNLSCLEAYDIYHRKDLIEKAFDDLKNFLDMSRFHTHSTETTEGKLFVAFISLIIATTVEKKLKDIKAKTCSSKSAIIEELDKIKVITLPDKKRLMNPLTRLQREILEAFGLNFDDFKAYLNKGTQV
jgi:transposase